MVDISAIVNACDEKELTTMLEAIRLRNKSLLVKWIATNPDLNTPPVVAPKMKEPPADLTDKQKQELDNLVVDMVKMNQEGEKGAPLEDVIKELMNLGSEREHIECAIDRLFDKGTLYEPYLARLKLV